MARPRTHSVDETFFDSIGSEKQAYWLGFLYADGHPASRHLALTLSSKDGHHIQKFQRAVGSEHAIRTSEKTCSIAVCSTYLSNRFRELRKEFFLPDDLVRHTIRGIFDGDGCISRRQGDHYTITIAGNKALLKKIRNSLIKEGIKGSYIRHHTNPKAKTHVLYLSRLNSVCQFRDWIYNNSSIFLARKKKTFDLASPIKNRICQHCKKLFSPRYRHKGRFCSRSCYMRNYYIANPHKWKNPGGSWVSSSRL